MTAAPGRGPLSGAVWLPLSAAPSPDGMCDDWKGGA